MENETLEGAPVGMTGERRRDEESFEYMVIDGKEWNATVGRLFQSKSNASKQLATAEQRLRPLKSYIRLTELALELGNAELQSLVIEFEPPSGSHKAEFPF
jgi:hypothetical protein